MFVVFALVVAAAGAATWYAPRWYGSEVQLLAKPSHIGNPLETPGAMRDEVVLYISTLRSIISSDNVLASALLRLAGSVKPPELPEGGLPNDPAALANWRADVAGWDKTVKQYVTEHTEEINELRERVSVVTPGGPDATFTQTLTVKITWPEERELAGEIGRDARDLAAERAYLVAGHLVDAYKFRYAELEWRRATDATKFLAAKLLTAARKDLDNTVAAYSKFVQDVAGADIADMQQMAGRGGGFGAGKSTLATSYAQDMTGIQESIAGLESTRKALEAQLAEDDPDAMAIPDSIMASNPSVGTLKAHILSVKLRINALAPRYTEDYRELKNARAELVSAQTEFKSELTKQLKRTQQELDVLQARRDKINESFDSDRKRLQNLALKTAEMRRLRAAQEAAQRRFDDEKDRVVSAATAEELSNVPILLTVLGEASRPDPAKPQRPVVLLNMILAVAGGFILALIYAFSADHFDHSLKSIDAAERYLGLPVLASVPRFGRRMIHANGGA